MSRVLWVAIVHLTAATMAWATASDRYMGRELAVERRARTAEVERLLPMSCPPFYLRGEDGRIIDPAAGAAQPVSTRQTCGVCHDYARITQGYHFQAGYDERALPQPLGESAPVPQSPGFHGKWQVLYQRQLAPKIVDGPAAIDLTSFDWVVSCGICHPGGGPMEFDRADRRYSGVQAQDPALAATLDGDYHGARWHETGVVEADCFMCHLDGYDFSSRVRQLKKGNFRWAATEAAGIGVVTGAVNEGQIPGVHYRAGLFAADGRVHLPIQRPDDTACLACHDRSGVQKRGSAWATHYMQDVHAEQGMGCTDCHVGDIRHNFAKGDSASLTVRDDLDGTMASCQTCHESGLQGAPIHTHPGIPPLHFERMACTACHVTRRPFAWTQAVDTLTGDLAELALSPETTVTAPHLFGARWGTVAQDLERASVAPLARDVVLAAAQHAGIFDPETAAPAEQLKRILENLPREESRLAVCLVRGKAHGLVDGEWSALPWTPQPLGTGELFEAPVACAVDAQSDIIKPQTYQTGAFWGYLAEDGFRPLLLSDMAAAWAYLKATRDGAASAVADDNFDGRPEANTPDEIGLVGWALTRTLTRVSNPTLVYVRGERAFRVEVEEASPEHTAHVLPYDTALLPEYCRPLTWDIGHGVEPVGQALGRGVYGCRDCHARRSPFMMASVVTDPFDDSGQPVFAPAYTLMGLSERQLLWGELRESGVKGPGHWLPIAAVLACALHFLGMRAGFLRRPAGLLAGQPLHRHEAALVLAILSALGALGATAVAFRFTGQTAMGRCAHITHHWAGIAAAACGALLLLALASALVRRGRFSAGQRFALASAAVVFITTAASGLVILSTLHVRTSYQQLAYLVHDAAALLLSTAAIVLVYRHSVSARNARIPE